MTKRILQRSARLLALLVLSSIVIFAFSSANATDTITANYGSKVASTLTSEQLDRLADYWGQNTPFFEKYLTWLEHIFRGDLGVSLKYNDSVVNVIATRGLSSILLLAIAWIISSIGGYALGIIAGLKQGSLLDRLITNVAYILTCTPTFWVAMLLLYIFAIKLRLFPIGFSSSIGFSSVSDSIWHATLPALTLSAVGLSRVAMHTREKMVDVVTSDYITHAKFKGIGGVTLFKEHIFKNVSIPAISIQFSQIAEIISGSIAVETVFSYPGLGSTLVQAASTGDASLLAGITLLSVTVVFFANFISDIIVARIDPRVE